MQIGERAYGAINLTKMERKTMAAVCYSSSEKMKRRGDIIKHMDGGALFL